jgi:hypothetical protein
MSAAEPKVDQGRQCQRLLTQSTGQHHLTWTGRSEVKMPKGKLSPEVEVIAAYGAAVVAAFQVLINCLEENGALEPGQFPAVSRRLHGNGEE